MLVRNCVWLYIMEGLKIIDLNKKGVSFSCKIIQKQRVWSKCATCSTIKDLGPYLSAVPIQVFFTGSQGQSRMAGGTPRLCLKQVRRRNFGKTDAS